GSSKTIITPMTSWRTPAPWPTSSGGFDHAEAFADCGDIAEWHAGVAGAGCGTGPVSLRLLGHGGQHAARDRDRLAIATAATEHARRGKRAARAVIRGQPAPSGRQLQNADS